MDLESELVSLLDRYKDSLGTTSHGAVRDLLTEIVHYCRKHGIEFEDRVSAALDVAEEESATNV